MPMAATSLGGCAGEGVAHDLDRRLPDLFGVVLDPAVLGIELAVLGLRGFERRSLGVEQDGAAGGRSLVDGEDFALRSCAVLVWRFPGKLATIPRVRARRALDGRAAPAKFRFHDRPVRPADQLFARVGDGPLRLPLHVLHGGRHDVPAEGGAVDARGTRSAVFGLRREGRAQAAADGRRAAGPAQRDGAGAQPRAACAVGGARRTDADDERQSAREVCRRSSRTPVFGASTCRSTRSIRRSFATSRGGAGSSRCSRASTRRWPPGLQVKINAVALRGVNEDEIET